MEIQDRISVIRKYQQYAGSYDDVATSERLILQYLEAGRVLDYPKFPYKQFLPFGFVPSSAESLALIFQSLVIHIVHWECSDEDMSCIVAKMDRLIASPYSTGDWRSEIEVMNPRHLLGSVGFGLMPSNGPWAC